MGGFIAANQEGVTTTLGRGGSDFSAALVGAAIDADGIDIWTDVDGVLTCDPTLVPGTHPVKTISFDEAAELAYFGAKALHPATVLPAKEKNIPVWILNSRRPEAPGTKIVANAVSCTNVLKSVACKKGITVSTSAPPACSELTAFCAASSKPSTASRRPWTWSPPRK